MYFKYKNQGMHPWLLLALLLPLTSILMPRTPGECVKSQVPGPE